MRPKVSIWPAAALLLAWFGALPAEAGTLPGHLEFQVLRDGQPFGRQSISVSINEGALTAQTSAELRFAIGPLTLFHYTQHCSEDWRDGALQRLRCMTHQNGRDRHIEGALANGALRLNGSAGALVMSQQTLPTSWWTRPPLTTREMINTDTGERLPVRVSLIGHEIINLGGVPVATDHIRVAGTLVVDLWYDGAGHWVNCAFTMQGQHMSYRLITPVSEAPS